MDGRSSTGSPSAASSRQLPARPDTPQPADTISASKDSRDSVSLLGSQEDQSPAETHQSPSTHRTAKKHQTAKEHWSPAEKHQRLTEIQWTAEKPHHLGLTEQINWKDSLTEKQESEDSPGKPDPLKPNHLPVEQQSDSPLTEKQKTKDQLEPDEPSPTQPEVQKPDPLCPDQKKPGDLFHLECKHQTLGGLCLTNQKIEEDSPSPNKDLTIFTSAINKQNREVELPLSESKDQQNHQDLPVQKPTSTTHERHQHHQDSSPPTHLNTQHSLPPPPEVLPLIIHPTEIVTLAPLFQASPTPPTPVQSLLVQAPLVQASLVQAPPVQAPPIQAPLVQPPPVQAPLAHAPPIQAPPVQPPPVQAPPVQAPLVQAPPVQPPPVQAPPVHAPLVQASPVQTPMFQAPTVQALLVKAPTLTIDVFSDQVQPCSFVSSKGEPKLCGFLQKQGGPLKAWKQRWFTYEEKKNQLFYYRTPQDVTPLGRVELCSATFTYPLKGEKGTFHIKTPERTFILKAVNQELMLYWLQQLQVKRWQHRQTSTCSDPTNNNSTDDFLPVLKSPLGLVGEAAANVPSQRAPLSNVSIKHPLIEIQNSVHSLRKRSSQDGSQSVFHVEAPPWIPLSSADTSSTTDSVPLVPRTPIEPPPPALSLTEPAGQVTPTEVRELDSWNWKMKRCSLSTMMALRRDTVSSDRMTRLQQEKEILMEEVKAQKELVWILHKALEESQLEKRTCAEFLAEKGEQERLEVLRHRERQAADLRGRLEDAKMEVETMRMSLAQKDAELVQLQDYIGMLIEKNNAKQEVIIKLSDQVTACMSSVSGSDSQTFRQLQQEIENLRDDIEAYKIQNKFLNSEIYQLTKLWRTSSEQEKSLIVKCAYLEASNCQVESRYLGVLRQLHETRSLDPIQRAAIQKMIEDALKGELKSIVKLNMARDHDEYGFKIIPDYEVEDMKLLAKIQALEIRSHNLLHQEGGECPLLSRWAQYLAGRSDDDLCPSPELKGLLRGGVPQEYRQRVWRWMVRTRTRTIREHHPQRYQQLCEKSRTCPHLASRQIELDLHRTLTTNRHFSSPSSPALQQLRRVLLAFSWQNPAIGYCQGLNRLAAITLLVLQSEEDAFWCLVAVVETIMPQEYYTKNLVASQADQQVLKDFLVEKLPRLAAHFEDHSIDVSLITFNWFLVVFVESLPSDILLPLWDAFLYEGTKVIFRYTLALFKYKEDDILKIQDSVEIYQYLRFFTKTISDGRRLTSIAFNDMNPFPGRLLRNRRALHLERLQGELRQLEEQQREFVSESVKRKDKDLDTMVSEDEEEL